MKMARIKVIIKTDKEEQINIQLGSRIYKYGDQLNNCLIIFLVKFLRY